MVDSPALLLSVDNMRLNGIDSVEIFYSDIVSQI